MYKLKSAPALLFASLSGLLFALTLTPQAMGQVESQINRPSDSPNPSQIEREAAISELIVRMEQSWRGTYEEFLQRKLTPISDLGKSSSNYSDQSFEAIAQGNPKASAKTLANPNQSALQLKSIQKTLIQLSRETKQRTALVYIRPGKTFTTLILVTPNGEPLVYLNRSVSESELMTVSDEFLKSISSPRLASRQRYLNSAQKLNEWLIQPLTAELAARKIDTLMLCTGAGLRGIPFAALYDGKKFLVERYNLSLIPAFSLVQLQYANLKNSQTLAAGAATFQTLNPLPSVPLELASIQRTSPSSKVLLNPNFTVEKVRSELQTQPYQVLHLATHGEFRPGSAKNSFIQFWDSQLHLDQLNRLNLGESRLQLLVLSACKTALGDVDAELGFSGLALYSGVPSAIGSLWSISDPGTLAFMDEFYRQLRTAPTRSAALRQTQLKMISGALEFRVRDLYRSGSRTALQLPAEFESEVPDNLNSPYFWAPFVLVGNPW